MKPSEALEQAIFAGLISSTAQFKPGAIIPKLSQEVREALQDVKASDTQVRVDWFLK